MPEQQPGSLGEYINELARTNAHGEYVEIDRYGRTTACSYGELHDRALGYVPMLRQQKSAGTEVAILSFESILDFVVSAWACLFAGLTWLPLSPLGINRNNRYFETQLGYLLDLFSNRLLISDKNLAVKIRDNFPSIGSNDILIMDSAQAPLEQYTYAPVRSDILIATSGTTGEPKLARLDAESLMNRFYDGFTPNDRRVSLYSLAHHSVAGIRMLLPLGKRIVYLHPLRLLANPGQWFSIIDRYRVTDAGMSTTIAAMLSQQATKSALPFSMESLERLSFGAEIIVPAQINTLLDALRKMGMPQVSLSFVYSMTETGPVFRSILKELELEQVFDNSEGMLALDDCVPGWSVRVVGPDNNLVRQGEVGRIEVYSKHKLFSGYANQARKTFMTEDGWFKTGDLGKIQHGRLIPMGRESTIINMNARKIACEEIEKALQDNATPGLRQVFAAPLRTNASHTDELAIFFEPDEFDEHSLHNIQTSILATISNSIGIAVTHLVAVRAQEIERTDTLKIRRAQMVSEYQLGRWKNLLAPETIPISDPEPDLTRTIQALWMQALTLPEPPMPSHTFDDLGGDSLGAAKLVFAYEEQFARPLPLQRFFDHPSVANMVAIASQSPASGIDNISRETTEEHTTDANLVQKIAAYTATWHGERLFDDSLVRGENVTGSSAPIFWIFQGNHEFTALAGELGSKQPLYGMRSCQGILPTREYSANSLQPVIDRYLWEIMAIAGQREFYLGGNCQGAIIALLIARRLAAINRAPQRLFLHEWSFDYGAYHHAVEFIYGERSYTAARYTPEAIKKYRLAETFPNFSISSVPAAHGHFFEREEVPFLGQVLRKSTRHRWADRLPKGIFSNSR